MHQQKKYTAVLLLVLERVSAMDNVPQIALLHWLSSDRPQGL
jgi:hypothetical protein